MSDPKRPDIFYLTKVIQDKVPEFLARVKDDDLAAVSIAIPDILADAEEILNEVLPFLDSIPEGDIDALGDALVDLHETLLHTKEQVDAADKALRKLIKACTPKPERAATRTKTGT